MVPQGTPEMGENFYQRKDVLQVGLFNVLLRVVWETPLSLWFSVGAASDILRPFRWPLQSVVQIQAF